MVFVHFVTGKLKPWETILKYSTEWEPYICQLLRQSEHSESMLHNKLFPIKSNIIESKIKHLTGPDLL